LPGLAASARTQLLINSRFGNRLWLGAVLTDMALQQDELTEKLCPEGCRICLDACRNRRWTA